MIQLTDRFNNKVKVNPQSNCWEWQGSKVGNGYGQVRWPTGKDKMCYTHRIVAGIKYNKTLNSDDYVMHSCDNPSCCNPNHLSVGTSSDNIKDSMAKGRFKKAPEHYGCNHKIGYCKHAIQTK